MTWEEGVDDYIDGVVLSAFDPTSGCPFGPGIPICFQYQNFAKAKINGFELESVYDAGWGYAGLSASVIDGHTISYKGGMVARSARTAGRMVAADQRVSVSEGER